MWDDLGNISRARRCFAVRLMDEIKADSRSGYYLIILFALFNTFTRVVDSWSFWGILTIQSTCSSYYIDVSLLHWACVLYHLSFRPRIMDAQLSLFSLKSRTFGLGQTSWADKFWGIWGIFRQTISTHLGKVSPLSLFSIIQPLFLQKTKPLYPHPKYWFGIGIWWIWDLVFVCP